MGRLPNALLLPQFPPTKDKEAKGERSSWRDGSAVKIASCKELEFGFSNYNKKLKTNSSSKGLHASGPHQYLHSRAHTHTETHTLK